MVILDKMGIAHEGYSDFTDDPAGTRSITNINKNPLLMQTRRKFNIVSGPYVRRQVGNSDTWFLGKFKKAFRYNYTMPLQTFRMNPSSSRRFNNDVVFALKVRRKGSASVIEPRYVIKATAP